MEALSSLEKTIAGWFENLPHLPKGLRLWLVENIWWLVIVGIVISIAGAVNLMIVLFAASAFLGTFFGVAAASALPQGLVSIATLVVTTIIEITAIQPLKEKKKRGWDLLFLVAIISIVGAVIGAVIGFNFFAGIIGVAIGGLISFYLLFELRGHYIAEAEVVAGPNQK